MKPTTTDISKILNRHSRPVGCLTIVAAVIIVAIIIAAIISAASLLTMLLWNAVLPELLDLNVIGYWLAMKLTCALVFLRIALLTKFSELFD